MARDDPELPIPLKLPALPILPMMLVLPPLVFPDDMAQDCRYMRWGRRAYRLAIHSLHTRCPALLKTLPPSLVEADPRSVPMCQRSVRAVVVPVHCLHRHVAPLHTAHVPRRTDSVKDSLEQPPAARESLQ